MFYTQDTQSSLQPGVQLNDDSLPSTGERDWLESIETFLEEHRSAIKVRG